MAYWRPRYFNGLFGGDHDFLASSGPAVSGSRNIVGLPQFGGEYGCEDGVVDNPAEGPCRQGAVGNVDDFTCRVDAIEINALTQDHPEFYPEGTTVFGPGLVDIDPAPDFALVTFTFGASNYWGFHGEVDGSASCGVSDEDCGPYRFFQPELVIDLSAGELRKAGDYSTSGDLSTLEDPFVDGTWHEDPTVEGSVFLTDGDHPTQVLSGNDVRVQGFLPGEFGYIKPAGVSYAPDADTEPQMFDVPNTATEYLWAWDDVAELEVVFNYGNGKPYNIINWNDNSAGNGGNRGAGIVVVPFWLLEPAVEEPGTIAVGAVARGVRRRRRVVGRAVSAI